MDKYAFSATTLEYKVLCGQEFFVGDLDKVVEKLAKYATHHGPVVLICEMEKKLGPILKALESGSSLETEFSSNPYYRTIIKVIKC
jgi:hypothetical protein